MITPRPYSAQIILGIPAELGRGHRLVAIIETALKRRRMLELRGCSKKPPHVLATCRMKLEAWCTVNRHPWPATVAAFCFLPELRQMMPGNAEGLRLLEEAEQLVADALNP